VSSSGEARRLGWREGDPAGTGSPLLSGLRQGGVRDPEHDDEVPELAYGYEDAPDDDIDVDIYISTHLYL
jgi:hypothetical protein